MFHLHDSKSVRVQPLTPATPGKVGIYLCGAIAQGSPHAGYLRAAVSFDMLIRRLRHNGYEVTYVRNVTDIDDEILHKSAEVGWDWWVWAYRFEHEFTQACETLGVQAPTYEPRATGHIPEQLDLAQSPIDTGHAYSGGHGGVHFDARSQAGYGLLIRQRLVDMRTTENDAQIDEAVEAGKRDPRNFALWKATKFGEPATVSWGSPRGHGRPGWHLECSAMLRRYLGDEFDIRGGGTDLHFPHHENKQAQLYGAGQGFVCLWVHNAWVTTRGEEMSKSLGNVLSVGAFTEEYPAVAVCWALFTVHRRSSTEWGAETLSAAYTAWEKFSTLVARAIETAGEAPASGIALAPANLLEAFVVVMDDDLNVVGAPTVLHERLRAGNAALVAGDVSGVYREQILVCSMLGVLGLDPASEQWRGQAGIGAGVSGAATAEHSALDTLVQAVLKERTAARAVKDRVRADELRDRLAVAGVIVANGRDGATRSAD